jgi:hypothetical protein
MTSLRKNQIGKQGISPSFNSFQTCEKSDLLPKNTLRTMTNIIHKNAINSDIGYTINLPAKRQEVKRFSLIIRLESM